MSACGATHPHLPSENFCREPAGHDGQHMAHDSQGRPEYVWTAGDVWDWAPDDGGGSPSAAVPDPADVEKAAVERVTGRRLPDREPAPQRRCVWCGSTQVNLWNSWNVAGEWTCDECTPSDPTEGGAW